MLSRGLYHILWKTGIKIETMQVGIPTLTSYYKVYVYAFQFDSNPCDSDCRYRNMQVGLDAFTSESSNQPLLP